MKKNPNIAPERKNNITKKRKTVLKKIFAAICVYLVLNGFISTAAVQYDYVDWNNSVRHGTDYVLTQKEKDKIPDGAYLDRMIENLNPVNLIDDAIGTARSRR